MSRLYFTSSYLKSKALSTLDELFLHFKPEDVLLVFDTNLIVDFRDFYCNPQLFKSQRQDPYFAMRYLVEQIDRYQLEVNASFGIEESSRTLNDFSILPDKYKQTYNALMTLLYNGVNYLDDHSKRNVIIEPIKDNSIKALSKIESLKQTSIFQHLLIMGYLSSLKIVELKILMDIGRIGREEAYVQYLDFVMNDINCASGISLNYAYHIFGGASYLNRLLFIKKIGSSSKEEIIHQIFNGSIDLIFPYLVDKGHLLPAYEGKYSTPVFVTRDERIAEIHSFHNTRMIINNNGTSIYNPEVIENTFSLKHNLSWTMKEVERFNSIISDDMFRVLFKGTSPEGEKKDHLLTKVPEMEESVLKLIN
jgi:hypothetical protein